MGILTKLKNKYLGPDISTGKDTVSILNYQRSLDGKLGPCDYFNYNFKTNHFWFALTAPFIKIITHIGWRITVEGRENIPKGTNIVFMPNHLSHFDSFVTGTYFPKAPIIIADEKLYKNKIFTIIAKMYNAFPVRKGTKSIAIVEYAIDRINSGDTMMYYPEGQRHKNPEQNSLNPGKLGAGMLAHAVKAPIVPIYIYGTEFAMPVGKKLTVGRGVGTIKITVKFGKPVYLEDLRKLSPSKEVSQLTVNRIMEGIEKLRPNEPYKVQRTQ